MKKLLHDVYFRAGVLFFLFLSTAVFCYLLPEAKVSNESGVVQKLPEVIPGYYSVAVEKSEGEKKWLPDTTGFTKRLYYPNGSDKEKFLPISLSLIVSGGDERSLHRPEVCMDGQGWQITTKQVRSMELNGEKLEVMDLSLKRESNGKVIEAHYYFFWVGKDISTPHYRDMKLRSLWDNFTKNLNHRWAYPAVMVYVNPFDEEQRHELNWKKAEHFLQHALPVFHKQFGAVEE